MLSIWTSLKVCCLVKSLKQAFIPLFLNFFSKTPQTYFQARKEAMSSRRKMLLDQLFDKWDNDGSGYLDQDEVENVMMKYKDGLENEAIEIGLLIAFYQIDPYIISLLRNTDF